ncbi:MAG: hypothetical protein NTV99_09990 [Deltaproteobacteria bacterium]|nr:hypothetical protein [Deltaproteobacteria bacterium]
MDRDKLIERLKETRDPDERNRILEILSSHEGKGTPAGAGSSRAVPGGRKAVSGIFLGYVVGALFLAGGSWMVYNGFVAFSRGSKRGGIVALFTVGVVLLVLGVLAVFRAGRVKDIPEGPPPDVQNKDRDIFRLEP